MPITNSLRPRSAQALGLLAWLLLTFAAGATGAMASATAATFYQQLLRPAWAPPGWLFGPVWTVLNCMIGVAAWLFFTLHRGGLAVQSRTAGMRLAGLQPLHLH